MKLGEFFTAIYVGMPIASSYREYHANHSLIRITMWIFFSVLELQGGVRTFGVKPCFKKNRTHFCCKTRCISAQKRNSDERDGRTFVNLVILIHFERLFTAVLFIFECNFCQISYFPKWSTLLTEIPTSVWIFLHSFST